MYQGNQAQLHHLPTAVQDALLDLQGRIDALLRLGMEHRAADVTICLVYAPAGLAVRMRSDSPLSAIQARQLLAALLPRLTLLEA
jgi:hypothetical protein